MRAEPPVHRLSGVGRPRGHLLPVTDTDPNPGWTPAPDDPLTEAAPSRPEDPWPVVMSGRGPEMAGPGAVAGPGADLGPGAAADPGRTRTGDPVAGPGGSGATAPWRDGITDRVPVGLRGGGRTVPARAAVTAVVIAVFLIVGLMTHRMGPSPTAVTVPAGSAGGSATTASTRGTGSGTAPAVGSAAAVGSVPATPTSAGVVVVDVEGKVRRPGLVRVPGGSRVADAVQAAGGPVPGAALIRINLARLLGDGEQIVVPGPHDPIPSGANGAGPPGGSGAGGAAAGTGAAVGSSPLDLNTATESQLDTLPGVGPVIAGRIVQWRTAHGRFTSVDQLGEVSGIGDTLLGRLRPLVRV